MGHKNQTTVTEFFLIGLSQDPRTQILLFLLFFTMYLLTIFGNGALIYVVAAAPRMHTPMYYFLCNLSVLDLLYSSTTVPKMLLDMLSAGGGRISLLGCMTQMCTYMFLGEIECVLLAVMAYDRYVAICRPLRYGAIMSWKLCKSVTVILWLASCIFSTLPTNLKPPVFCEGNRIDHFVCEVIALLKLVCGDTSFYEAIIFGGSLFTLLAPFVCVMTSYTFIIRSVVKISSAGGRAKTFSTCASHLAVVLTFYGTSTAMYLGPTKNLSKNQKYIAVIYGVVTPMVNPFIYSLRNKDVKDAASKILQVGCFYNHGPVDDKYR